MVKSAYIHIPFCKSKCNYCSFISFLDLDKKEQYLSALKKQVGVEYLRDKLNTLYFGGGTPSLLEINEVKSIYDLFNYEPDAEITFEVNPDSVDLNYFQELKKIGVNRISIGSQTFDGRILKLIGRRHDSSQISEAVENAQKAGFNNISLDFIYGLPTQSVEDFKNDIKTGISLGVQHISLYGLKIEEGCYFYNHVPDELPDLDLQSDMYISIVELLKNNGYLHYEISNFALPGFSSRHNLNYWDNKNYYGFGCAASGYIDDIRYQNEENLEKYIANPVSKSFEQKLSGQEILEEAIFLGLRKTDGINVLDINTKFDIDFNQKYSKILTKYSKYFIKTSNGWALDIDGMLVSNEILSEFID